MIRTFEFLGRQINVSPRTWAYDYDPARSRPMQVLSLGLSRTGTASLNEALQILGYHDVHHMSSCFANPPDCDIWLKAVNAKFFNKGKPFTCEAFNMLLGDCMAVTDLPSAAFVEELIHAYPDAQVILTTRNVDDWYTSVCNTIGVAYSSRIVSLLAMCGDPVLSRYLPMVNALWSGFFRIPIKSPQFPCGEQVLKARFVEHYQTVRDLVPKERLLEREIGEGWGRICQFLDKPIPAVSFPRVNDKEAFARLFSRLIGQGIERLLWKLLQFVALAAGLLLLVLVVKGRLLANP